MELPALMPACSPGILPRGVGELPFLSFIGQFHSVLSKDMEELCHLGLTAFFQPGVVIIWYILRSHTLFYLNLLNITAATYWETMRCTTCGRCFQPFLYSLQSMHHSVSFSSVQSLSRVRLFATPWITARQASLSITNSRSSLKLMSIESVMPSSHLLLCRPLLLLPPIPPSLRVFPMSQLFAWGGQSTGVSASASVLPKKSQDWSPLEWTGWISLQSKGLSRVFSNTTVQKHKLFGVLLFSWHSVQLSHSYMTTGKTIALTRRAFGGQVMSLLFNMLSRLVIRNFICIWNISIFPLVRKSKNSLNFMEIGFCQKFEIKLFFKKRSLSHFYLLFYELSGYILAKCKSHIAVLFFTNFYKLSHILKSKYLLYKRNYA